MDHRVSGELPEELRVQGFRGLGGWGGLGFNGWGLGFRGLGFGV